MDQFAFHFVLHGTIILATGIVGGLPFARAIKADRNVVAWRVVHSGGSMAGVMLLAVSSTLHHLTLPSWGLTLFAVTLIGGTYALVVGMVVAAATGARGLSAGGSAANRLVNVLYVAGTVASLAGCGLMLVGLLRTALDS